MHLPAGEVDPKEFSTRHDHLMTETITPSEALERTRDEYADLIPRHRFIVALD